MFAMNGNTVVLWWKKVTWQVEDEDDPRVQYYGSEAEAKALCTDQLESLGIPFAMTPVDQTGNEWIEGKQYPDYAAAEVALAAGYDNYTSPEELQDVASLMFVLAAEAGRLDLVTIAEHPSLFLKWTPEWTGKAGTILFDEGVLYKSIHDIGPGQNTKPSETPAMWTRVADPAEEWPEWMQPIGAHDAYQVGAKVSHTGKHWRNIHGDGNIWEPGVYGWEEQ